jgi:hypothetical protein
MFVWFYGRVVGPLEWWEVSLLRTKTRYFLFYSSDTGWMSSRSPIACRSIGPQSISTPPYPPLRMRLLVRLRKLAFRQVLRMHHV